MGSQQSRPEGETCSQVLKGFTAKLGGARHHRSKKSRDMARSTADSTLESDQVREEFGSRHATSGHDDSGWTQESSVVSFCL